MEGSRKVNGKYYRNPCLTIHQPWASLLLSGMKHLEGRSWPAPLRGCVEVVGCLRGEELAYWNEVPEWVRLQPITNFSWLCEQPQKLRVPIEMRGSHGVYDLERKIYEVAIRDLVPVDSSLLVKFSLPNPKDPFSLKPGSVSACFPKSKASEVEKSSSLSAAIAAAIAASTQYSKKVQISENNAFKIRTSNNFTRKWQLKSNSSVERKMVSNEVGTLTRHNNEGNNSSFPKQFSR
ncbi:hypothetical protein Vadar_005998 [Vaccinium darrowii]|uniref:Uncharacterized protein n=1 Tax=Vaccinium darrowii TaxID=229202 RepID=A0ACB7X8A5_9ERIC|nr:hypothetical protein Vadar_005998 [Vaccinium darrowii]